VNRAGPALGQHSQYIFEELLGYSESRISDLVARGVLG
jgi:crotonobetainyl-CoA:carnitine CoA-transferase CaiB-like acyl-CoA transferase